MADATDEFILLCTRKFSGEASHEECQKLDGLLRDPEYQASHAELQARWQQADTAPKISYDADKAFDRVAGKLFQPSVAEREPKIIPFWRGNVFRGAMAAAVVLVVFFSFWTALPRATPPASSWIEKRVAMGKRATVTLGDGTQVTLNSGSVFSYPENFGETRTVRLAGEGYFEVAHDALHPFIVEAGGLKTRVLGTKFNVSAFADDMRCEISLVEGRVEVSDTAAKATVLVPGQRFGFDSMTGKSGVEHFDIGTTVGWTNGWVVFQDERLELALRKLERCFAIKIKLMDASLAGKAVSGRFKDEKLDDILDMLAFSCGVEYKLVYEDRTLQRVEITPAR